MIAPLIAASQALLAPEHLEPGLASLGVTRHLYPFTHTFPLLKREHANQQWLNNNQEKYQYIQMDTTIPMKSTIYNLLILLAFIFVICMARYD